MRKFLFLYLALACFVGLLAIFVVDGYLGIYDTLEITAREQTQKIEPDEWLRQDRFRKEEVRVNRGDNVSFTYEVDNRRFSSYRADIEVSVWHSQQKVRDLISQQLSIAAFDKGQLEWSLDNTELLTGDVPPEQPFEYTVIIKRGEIERKIIVYINPRTGPSKEVPAPVR